MPPDIPRVITPQISPLPGVAPGMAAAPYAARERAGEQLTALGTYAGKIQDMIQKVEDHTAMLKAENQLDADINKFAEGLSVVGDHKEIPGLSEGLKTELTQKYSEMMGDNPRVWNAFAPHLEHRINEAQHVAEVKRLKMVTDEGRAELFDNIERKSATWGGLAPEQQKALESEVELQIESAKMSHLITAQEGRKMVDKFHTDKEESEIIKLTRSQDPATVEQGLANLQDPQKYQHVNEKQKAIFQEAGEKHLAMVNEKIEKHNDKLAVDTAVDYLDRTYTNADGSKDFESIEKSINDPDFRAEHNLDVERTNKVRSFFEAVRAQHDHIEHEAAKKENDGIIHEFLNHNYSKVLKMIDNPESQLSAEQKRAWVGAVNSEKREARAEARAERSEARESRAEHSDRMALDIEKKIINGEITDKLDIYKAIGKGLKPSDARRLMTDFGTLQTDLKHKLDAGDKYLESQIAPSKGAFLPSIPAEKARAQQAQIDLHKWVVGENKKYTDGKRPPVSPDEIYNKAVEIAPTYRMKIDEKIDNIKAGLKEKTTKPAGPPKVGEVQKGYRFLGGDPSDPKSWKQADKVKVFGVEIQQ